MKTLTEADLIPAHKGMALLRFVRDCQVHGAMSSESDGSKCSYFQSLEVAGGRLVVDNIKANVKTNRLEFDYRRHRCVCYLDAVKIFVRGEEPK